MAEVRFADGFDTAEPVAFGLPALELITVVAGLLSAYALVRSPLPAPLALPAAALLAVGGAAGGWLRHDGRSLVRWGVAALRYATAARPATWVIAGAQPPDGPPIGEEVPAAAPRAEIQGSAHRHGSEPWERWLEPEDAPPAEPVARTPLTLVPEEPAPPWEDDPGSDATEMDGDGLEPEDAPADDGDERGVILPIHRGDPDETEQALTVADAPAESAPVPQPAPGAMFVGATRRVTFFSLNGGSGRTTLATEVAALLARGARHHDGWGGSEPLRVALLDLDVRSATVAVRLGVPQPSVWDWVVSGAADPARLDDYMVAHRSGLRALLGPQKPLLTAGLTPAHLADVLHELERQRTHFIFIDVAADMGELTQWVLQQVHDIFVVITPTASGIQDAYRSTEALRRLGLRHKLRYVLNRSRGGFSLVETMGDLGGELCAEIPYDPRVEDAENRHRLVTEEGGAAAAAIERLAATLYPGLAQPRPRRRLSWRRRRAG